MLVWAQHLRGDLFSHQYPYLSFGAFLEPTVDVGIPDEQWQARDDLAPSVTDVAKHEIAVMEALGL